MALWQRSFWFGVGLCVSITEAVVHYVVNMASKAGPIELPPAPEIAQFRTYLTAMGMGCNQLTDAALGNVMARMGNDLDLAFTAIAMTPRPAWVEEFIGPLHDEDYPCAD